MACSLQSKVMNLEDWKAKHSAHLQPDRQFAAEPFGYPHTTWHWLICPCGAKHLTSRGEY